MRRGWCPSALRPMASGDGLLVRLRISGGVVPPALGHGIAEAARRFGNGLIDLTSRGNLQLRGVTEQGLADLQQALDGLGLLAGDALPGVMVSPLAGLDPACREIRPSLAALEAALDRVVLPSKFRFLIDGGGRLPLDPADADVAFVACDEGFDAFVGGECVGHCSVNNLAQTALDLSLSRVSGGGRGGGGAVCTGLRMETPPPHPPPQAGEGLDPIGYALDSVLGVGVAFGRMTADGLDLLASSGDELRLTPWRAVLIVNPRAHAQLTGFILDPDAPIRAVAACVGAPGCASGSTATQRDAAALAPFVGQLRARGIGLHVSGCAKGCAHAAPAPVTLIGRDGAYDLVRNGRAGDTPLLTGLNLAGVLAYLAAEPVL